MCMNSWKQAVSDSRWKLGAIIAIVLMAWVSNARADRPGYPVTTDFNNIGVDQLISVYKAAYIEFGYEFVEQEGQWDTTVLVFNFPNPDYPYKQKGYLSLRIDWQEGSKKKCTPCKVSGEVFGGNLTDYYSSEERVTILRKMTVAEKQATAKIYDELRANVKLPPLPQGGDGPFDYHYNIGYEELVSLYKKAYFEAGFKLQRQWNIYDRVQDKNILALYLTFSVPEHKKQQGMFEIMIISPSPPTQKCSPCEVRRESYRRFGADKGFSEWEKMKSADYKARAQIRLELNKMIPPAPADQSPGSAVE